MVRARLSGTTSVTVQGQITIPKSIRDNLGIKAGDTIEFLQTEKGVVVIRKMKVIEEVEL